MAKTTFIDENPAAGIPGTEITAALLNALNNHYHRGLAVDGDGALAYAADTGAADAYAMALVPALDAYIEGMPVFLKAAHANTGPSTLDINGLGAKSIKRSVTEALAAGDILAGQILCLVYDGVNFQLLNPDLTAMRGSVVDNAIKRGTLAELQALALGATRWEGWAHDKNTFYLYPGDEAIGLIALGGYAAGPADLSEERG